MAQDDPNDLVGPTHDWFSSDSKFGLKTGQKRWIPSRVQEKVFAPAAGSGRGAFSEANASVLAQMQARMRQLGSRR